MHRTDIAKMSLHYGADWLAGRLKKPTNKTVTTVLDEYGTDSFLKQISDPFWFQAFGYVLSYDWNSSSVTTVLTRVLKEALVPDEHGIAVCTGKGRTSRQKPFEIESFRDSASLIHI